MTVVTPEMALPVISGMAKYAQNSSISTGRPRTPWTSAAAGQAIQRDRLVLATPTATASGNAHTSPATAISKVSARPPSGPFG